jgi:hypothetical protein
MEAMRASETSFLQEPQGVTSQKTAFFKAIAVGTSTLHNWIYLKSPSIKVQGCNVNATIRFFTSIGNLCSLPATPEKKSGADLLARAIQQSTSTHQSFIQYNYYETNVDG